VSITGCRVVHARAQDVYPLPHVAPFIVLIFLKIHIVHDRTFKLASGIRLFFWKLYFLSKFWEYLDEFKEYLDDNYNNYLLKISLYTTFLVKFCQS